MTDTELRAPADRSTVTPAIELAVLAAAVAVAVASYFALSGADPAKPLLASSLVAVLLVANLVPGIALIMLLGRRIAMRRAARRRWGAGGGSTFASSCSSR